MSVATLNEALKQHLTGKDSQELAGSLGYNDPKSFEYHLTKIIDQPYLGLHRGFYDLHYGSRVLIQKLVDQFDIPRDLLTETLDYVDQTIQAYEAFPPNIQVDLVLSEQSKTKSIISRIPLAPHLKIDLNIEDYAHTAKDMFPLVQAKICDHYPKSETELLKWGQVKGYNFYYQQGASWRFDTNGQLLN